MNRRFAFTAGAVALSLLASATTFGQASSRSLFICNNGNLEGSVTSMKVNPDGTLEFVDKLITGLDDDPGTNAQCISITPNGKYLCTGHGTISSVDEQLTFIEVHADGTLTEVGQFLTPDSPLDVQWLDDEYIAVTHTDSPSFVLTYRFDPNVPSLSAVDTEAAGGFCTWMVMDFAHDLLYAQSSTGSQVTSFRVNANGTLDAIEVLSTGGTYPLGIGISPDGTRLYGGGGISNGGNKIIGMNVNPATGDLSNMATSPFISPGASPKLAVVSLDGQYAIAGHGTDATLRSFKINQSTGELVSTGFMYDIGFQGSLGEVSLMPTATRGGGTLMFVTDRDTINDGVRGVRSFTIGIDGSLNQNGTIVDTTGIAPYSISVWDPPAQFCATDLTGPGGTPDGNVDVNDLFFLLANWNTNGPGASIAPPTNIVDVNDLFVLLADFGPCVP